MPDTETLTDKRRRAGQATSERKAHSSRANGHRAALDPDNGHQGGRPLKPLDQITCQCRGEHVTGRQSCNRGRAERRRRTA